MLLAMTLDAVILPVVTFVATRDPVVTVEAFNVDTDIDVISALPLVKVPVAREPVDTDVLAARVPVVNPTLKRADPDTSRVKLGLVVATPTFPPVVKIFPNVLLFPVAANAVDTVSEPIDAFVD